MYGTDHCHMLEDRICKLEEERDAALAQAEKAEARAERLAKAAEPFVALFRTTSGRIPTERLSFAHWHELSKASAAAAKEASDGE